MTHAQDLGTEISLPGGTHIDPHVLRETALTLTDQAALGHPCALSKKNNITTCTHPDHKRDAGLAREWLQAAGLIDTPPNGYQRKQAGISIHVKATCPVCRQNINVVISGKIGSHRVDGEVCAGRGRKPRPAEQDAL